MNNDALKTLIGMLDAETLCKLRLNALNLPPDNPTTNTIRTALEQEYEALSAYVATLPPVD